MPFYSPGCRALPLATLVLAFLAVVPPSARAAPVSAADTLYRHGRIYTADAKNRIVEALAVRDGRIVYAGSEAGARAVTGPSTAIVDLAGKTAMPGLIDGHLHPLEGGSGLLKCSLHYERLTKDALRARLAECLARTTEREPDGWLEVVAWFQEGALPAGTTFSAADLDGLPTKRPIQILSSFGHTMLLNRRGLEVAGITATTPVPPGGRIARDADGAPTGTLEDKAFEPVLRLLPQPTEAQNLAAAKAALGALARQGVTTFLDAWASPANLAAFEAVAKAGALTARAHFAPEISPAAAGDPRQAVATVKTLARRYDGGAMTAAPGMTVRNAKLFLDGVITAPAMTGNLLAPYNGNEGTAAAPHWVPGPTAGPAVYFAPDALRAIVLELAAQGLEPHMHADGDGAVRAGLDAVAALRQKYPESRIRAALAHDELVDPADYPRFRALGVIPVLSLQWGKPAADTIDGAVDYLGPVRSARIEPSGVLARAGARIAFGSDWPVDPLDEWFALYVGVTRRAGPAAEPKYAGRLGTDPGLTRIEALRAITINAAYELHEEARLGSLEPGKFADFIVLDRDVLGVPEADIAGTRVLRTVVGGRTVYEEGHTP